MIIALHAYSKSISFGAGDFLPRLTLEFIGPVCRYSLDTEDEFGEKHQEGGLDIPIHLLAGRSDGYWYVSFSFIFGFGINYQWSY